MKIKIELKDSTLVLSTKKLLASNITMPNINDILLNCVREYMGL